MAVIYGHTEVISMFLEHGANINMQNNNLQTPLILAAIKGNGQTAVILLQNGANPYIKDESCQTFLDYESKNLKFTTHRKRSFTERLEQEEKIRILS